MVGKKALLKFNTKIKKKEYKFNYNLTFSRYIDNNDNDDLSDDDGDLGHFNVATSSIGSDYDYIENSQSTIDFQIDDKLLEILGPDG